MSNRINLVNKRFGRLIVLKFYDIIKARTIWVCKCDCGNIKNINGDHLKSGKIKSCGCLPTGSKLINLIGKRFEKLKVVKFYGRVNNKYSIWICKCDCGNIKKIDSSSLIRGHTKSCGCLYHHGMGDTAIYEVWHGMIKRCCNKKDFSYKHYGGRGIKVCKRWRNSFLNFYKDMGDKPKAKSIDRINNNGNYSLSNCRWATHREQMRNTRKNVWVKYKGKRILLIELAEKLNIRQSILYYRLRNGIVL